MSDLLNAYESVTNKIWRQVECDKKLADDITVQHSVSKLTAGLLASRDIDDVGAFLDSRIKTHMKSPFLLKDMETATNIVADAVYANKTIAVFGDYDVDGITSSALMKRYIKAIAGYSPYVYIPDRITEGYGPSIPGFDAMLEKGVDVCITVDCGIGAHEQIAYAKSKGMTVIVLDHHVGDKILPNADAIVNPNQIEDDSGYGYLPGVGVAFLFAVALSGVLRSRGYFEEKNIKEPDLYSMLDLVALGVVCDSVPLEGLNRAFVSCGLKVMMNSKNQGVRALVDVIGIKGSIDAYHLGYLIGPRINAAGRLGKPLICVELFCTDDYERVYSIAYELNNLNEARKSIEAIILQSALDSVADRDIGQEFMVVWGDRWHCGVTGIVASRIKDIYGLPVALITFDDSGVGKASVRGIKGLDCGKAVLDACNAGVLMNGGGHAMAAGFSVRREKMDEFMAFWRSYFAGSIADAIQENNNCFYDMAVSCGDLSISMLNEISVLAPFGAKNQEPTLLIEDVVIKDKRVIAGKHISCSLVSANAGCIGGGSVNAIAFNAIRAGLDKGMFDGAHVHVVGRVSLDSYSAVRRVNVIVDDVILL